MRTLRIPLAAMIGAAALNGTAATHPSQAAAYVAAISPANAAELTDEKFAELHRQLQPAKDEPWLTIPWRISLLDAQKAAAKERKPIFIWAMDGHPLGCT